MTSEGRRQEIFLKEYPFYEKVDRMRGYGPDAWNGWPGSGRMHRRGSPAEGRDLCAGRAGKAQQDPEGYAKVMQELQPELLQIQQKQDVDALCAFYDKAIAKLK